jgi:hypothetical protein
MIRPGLLDDWILASPTISTRFTFRARKQSLSSGVIFQIIEAVPPAFLICRSFIIFKNWVGNFIAFIPKFRRTATRTACRCVSFYVRHKKLVFRKTVIVYLPATTAWKLSRVVAKIYRKLDRVKGVLGQLARY